MATEINNGSDPHAVTAQGLYGCERVTEEQRQSGKTLNFSIIYGGGAKTVMMQLGVDYKEAQRLVWVYHQTRPGIKILNERISATLRDRGYITNLYGRRLHVEEDHKSLNALIQGSAADLMRDSVVSVGNMLYREYSSHIVNIVHDEIIIDASEHEIESLVNTIPTIMGNKTIEEVVSIGVDVEISRTNWADKEEFIQFSSMVGAK